ncbi:MAG: redoxin domain-containing protein [Spirochaetia bacterium]|nr:redoxin domain-containing protein [Spirochaetia bacterium]
MRSLLLLIPGLLFCSPIHSNPAPEFTHTRESEWINSKPVALSQLRGKVVLIDFWTFQCWNCYRSFPWLRSVEAQFHAQGLQIIGVHSPEFESEKVRTNIEAKVREFGLTHPIMIDTDFSYWNAMNNSYWPAFYLLDKKGVVRASYAGETHIGDSQAKTIEAQIKTLTAESN